MNFYFSVKRIWLSKFSIKFVSRILFQNIDKNLTRNWVELRRTNWVGISLFFIFVIHLEKLLIFTLKYDIYRSGVSSVSMLWMELRDRVWPGLRYLIISFWTTLFQYDCLIICLGRLWMMSSFKSPFLISSYMDVFLWFLLIPIYDLFMNELLVSFWRSTSLSDALF